MLARDHAPRLVLGVGASAGGLRAFRTLLAALPSDTGVSFLLVQHLDPKHDSMLVELLASSTSIPVHQAQDGMPLTPDAVYVIPPGVLMAVEDGAIKLSRPADRHAARRPVDHLFHSLAESCGRAGGGLILSGSGSDGSIGLRALKAAGGLALVQDPDEAEHAGMPRSAIEGGAVDLVVGLDEVPAVLERFAALGAEPAREAKAAPAPLGRSSLDEHELRTIAAVLQSRLDFDLEVYKPGTVSRRVLRRMLLLGIDGFDAYVEHLRVDPAARQQLVSDLLISVTDFFRDPEVFEVLRAQVVLPRIEEAREDDDAVRVWVAGCATGEEAYSIAIEILDAMADADDPPHLQVFATDIDEDALALARKGVYGATIRERISHRRLERYFDRIEGRGYRVRNRLRNLVSFARHDVTRDPPFSRMDLVSCRNLLIYLQPKAQQKVLHMLHFALVDRGHLLLGTSESTGAMRDVFEPVHRELRLYRKVGASRPLGATDFRRALPLEPSRIPRFTPRPERGERDDACRAILEAYVPPTVVVGGDGTVRYMHGELRPYLRFPQGESKRLELAQLVTPELATRVRAVVYKCRRDEQRTVGDVRLDGPGEAGLVTLVAAPATQLGEGSVVLTFERHPTAASPAESTAEDTGSDAVIAQLERELRASREDLRNTIEELETSNEELRSSHEESMSMNEELQAANEELEATTEELRSLNEELTTVNTQLREKMDQLGQAHDDLRNFFASARLVMVFLDAHLRIKRFTPSAGTLLGIDHADLGRLASTMSAELLQSDLADEAKAVLEHLEARSRELQTEDGRWITRRCLPYRTQERRIEGVVVTFVDVTDLKVATARSVVSERRQTVLARLGSRGLREHELVHYLEQGVREIQQALGTDLAKILELQPDAERMILRAGIGWRPGLVGRAEVRNGLDSQAGYTLRTGASVIVDDLSTERRFSGPQLLIDHGVVSGMSCVISDGEVVFGVLGVHCRTHRKFTPEDLRFLEGVASVIGSVIGRHHGRLRVALELGLTRSLADAEDVDSASRAIFGVFEKEMNLSVAELWWAEDDRLTCRQMYTEPILDRQRVVGLLDHRVIEPGEGLVGRVYQTREAFWITDLGRSVFFGRSEEARALGLRSGFGFPLLSGSACLGVITVLSSSTMVGGAMFLQNLESLGRWVGSSLARLAVEAESRWLAAVTASSHDAIVTWDLDGRIESWLGTAPALYGYDAAAIVGRPVLDLVPPDEEDDFRATEQRVRQGQAAPLLETRRLHRDGHTIEVEVRTVPLLDARGEVMGISSTERDISRRKATERRLVAADRQKDDFLAVLGHELRNPLAAINTAARMLASARDDAGRSQHALDTLNRQVSHMARLLDGLLDISRIVRNKIVLDRRMIDLVAVCQQCVDEVVEREPAPPVEIEFSAPAHAVVVHADVVRLRQIIDNLLTNAVKFTPDGGHVTVSVEAADGQALLTVKDDGVGIEGDVLPTIFDTFRQARQPLARGAGGLGLGLSLVRSLAKLHGGTAEAESGGPGKGSRFRVCLPLSAAAQPSPLTDPYPRPAIAPIFDALRILIIEDTADLADLLCDVLRLEGHTVEAVYTAEDGIERARSNPPDLVLCDIGLPGRLTGYDVARALRNEPALADTRLVALTGYGRPEDQARSKEAGFHAHLTKPLEPDRLAEALNRIAAERGVQSEAAERAE